MASHGTTSSDIAIQPYVILVIKSFIAGGIAGCCAKTSIAPLDRAKILLQVHNKHYEHLTFVQTLVRIYRHEGIPGLYKGNLAMMIRIFPYASMQYMSYEQYKKILIKMYGENNHYSRLATGSLAGVTAVVTTYPLDFLRAQLAFQVKGDVVYTGLIDAAKKVFKREGLRGFFHGLSPTILGMVPYAGISFYTYETLKHKALRSRNTFFVCPNPHNDDEIILKTWANLGVGAIAGAMSQTFSYPLDVARRRMQLSRLLPEAEKYRNIGRTLVNLYLTYGVRRGLYRGLTINYLRVVPQIAVSFTVYEFMKRLLHMETGIRLSTG